jgi:hypothetical protein
MTEESIRQQSYNDDLIKLKLHNISLNARPKVERRAQTKPVVTQQQIEDYRIKMMRKPVIIGGKKYKYTQPDQVPNLENVDDTVIQNVLTDKDILIKRKNLRDASDELNSTLERIKTMELNKKEKIIERNNEPDLTEKRKIIAEITVIIGGIKELRELIKEIEEYIVSVQIEIRNNEENKSINQAEEQRVKEINRSRVKSYQEQLSQINEGQFSVIQQDNETEEEWLIRLNEMAESPYDEERIKLESDIYNIKELRKNLKELIKDDVIIDDVIRSFNVVPNDVFQLNKIFNPYVKNKFIKVYGKFNPRIDEQTVYDFLSELLYEGKHGKKKENDGTDDIDNDVEVKKENLDKTSSSSVDEPKLGSVVGSMLNTAASMFADKLTGKPVGLLEYKPPDEEEKDEEEKDEDTFIYSGDRFDIILSKKNNDLKIYSHDNQKEFFIKPATTAKGQPRFLISKTGNEGEFFLFGGEKGISTGADILDYLSVWSEVYGDGKANREAENNRIDPPQLDYSIIKKYLGKSKTNIHANLRNYGLTTTTPKKKKIKYDDNREKFANLNNKELIGWGVGLPKDIPKELIPFGRCKLHLYKLYYDNEFVLKDSSGFNIPGLRNVKVSDEFVELIMKIHNKENISQSFINKLSKGEQDLYDLVIFKCGLKNLDIDHKTNVKNLKEKLATIEGEIEAGNDNKEVLKELYDVLQQLVIYKSINVSEAKKHYNSIKNDFF